MIPFTNQVVRVPLAGLLLALVCCHLMTGCSTSQPNPSKPETNTGYVDFYSDDDADLAWEIKQIDTSTGDSKTIYSEFEPVPGTTLRLAVPRGNYHFEVWFRNRVTDGAQPVKVSVENAKVTPVRVNLTPVGSGSIQQKVYGFRPSAKGYGHGTKVKSQTTEVCRIGAVAEPLQTYKPKEQMPYFHENQ